MITILVQISLEKDITKSDLDLRHLLVDTIESRFLGEVVEETSSLDTLEIVINVFDGKIIINDLQSLLNSLGYNSYDIKDTSIDDD